MCAAEENGTAGQADLGGIGAEAEEGAEAEGEEVIVEVAVVETVEGAGVVAMVAVEVEVAIEN